MEASSGKWKHAYVVAGYDVGDNRQGYDTIIMRI
jgi:hypothetical protein